MQICCVAGLEELAQEPEETVENHSTLHLVDYVERGIADFLKLGPIPFIELYGIVLNPFFFLVFWCKETVTEKLELVDLLDSL